MIRPDYILGVDLAKPNTTDATVLMMISYIPGEVSGKILDTKRLKSHLTQAELKKEIDNFKEKWDKPNIKIKELWT